MTIRAIRGRLYSATRLILPPRPSSSLIGDSNASPISASKTANGSHVLDPLVIRGNLRGHGLVDRGHAKVLLSSCRTFALTRVSQSRRISILRLKKEACAVSLLSALPFNLQTLEVCDQMFSLLHEGRHVEPKIAQRFSYVRVVFSLARCSRPSRIDCALIISRSVLISSSAIFCDCVYVTGQMPVARGRRLSGLLRVGASRERSSRPFSYAFLSSSRFPSISPLNFSCWVSRLFRRFEFLLRLIAVICQVRCGPRR